jgi:hypothetical protein
MRLLIGIIALIFTAGVIGVFNAVMPERISPAFIYIVAAVGYFTWLQFARGSGLVD